ncbi:glycosyltransferase [Phaeodactylibacter xiamenensis]|uniref:glycosyltransferase n=1 Tax=Phaeodactylibacter xiamenensis TaxID=1524460 RepID=UPI0024A88271|nr:glycosyltransferase [Phaeodactylibacter xiamenensis]
MKKILIPIDESWFQGGNHYFLAFSKSLEACNHPEVDFKICSIDNFNKTNKYDGILSVRCHLLEEPTITKDINKPIFLYHDDFHFFKFRTFFDSKKFYDIVDRVDLLFNTYALNMLSRKKFQPFSNKTYWVPLSVPESIFDLHDINDWSSRVDKILISGMTGYMYPLRTKIKNSKTLSAQKNIQQLGHGGYSSKSKGIFGDDYYRYLSKFKGAIVTSGMKPANFAVMKYFEIPACGCLPFLEDTRELKYLGFQDGLNCVIINKSNFIEKFKILDSPVAKEIAKSAHELIRARHTHQNRANFIATQISNFFKQRT